MKISRVVFSTLFLLSTFSCVNKYNGNTTNIVNTPNTSSSSQAIPSPSASNLTSTTIGNLKIETSPPAYTPSMSSTVGILINPIMDNLKDYKVTFETNNGFFLSWNSQVKNLGKETTYDDKNIYWSFTGIEKFKDADVKISVFNKTDNKLVAFSNIKILIDDKGMATVSK